MFFIGLFGVGAKAEPAGRIYAGCRCCHAPGPLQLSRKYQYFHAFFLPLFRFHSQYFATCPSCASIYEVEPSAGDRARREGQAAAAPEQLHLLQDNSRRFCPHCRAPISPDDQFCRRCGERL